MNKHAVYPPSALAATALCPGRPAAIKGLPSDQRDRPSQAATNGSRRHALLEWRWHHRGEPNPLEIPNPEGGTYQITSADVEAVNLVWPYIANHPAGVSSPGNQIWCEQRVDLSKACKLPPDTCYGTADWIMTTRKQLEIADAKFGHKVVDPDSLQLRAYAVGAGTLLLDPSEPGLFAPEYRQIRTIKLTILQPEAEEVVRSVVYPLDQIRSWSQEIGDIVRMAQDPWAERIPGEEQCRWCPAAATCKERLESVGQALGAMFEPCLPAGRELPPIASVDAITDLVEVKMTQDPGDLGAEEIGRLLDQAPLIEQWLKDVRKRAATMLETGEAVPGWKLIEGRRSRKWNNDEGETVAVLKKLGLAVSEIYERKLLGPAGLEKLPKVAGNKTKRERLAELWHWSEGKPTLAPESDPAPAIGAPTTMFDPIETDALDWL